MAINPILAVIFDMGGTLEDLSFDDAIRKEATRGLRECLRGLELDPGLSLPNLQATFLSGIEAYQIWRDESERELPPERVWRNYIFPDHGLSPERLEAAAEEVMFFCETHYQIRRLRPEAVAALDSLQKEGIRLAIISNIVSRELVPRQLAEYGIAHYFDPIITSSSFGWRKPNVRIFEEATRLMQLPPEACAYVGDTVSRDVIGARRAGYRLAIQIRSSLTDKSDRGTDHVPPDAVITDLTQVVDVIAPYAEASHGH
ncbi:MAG TPA: HAD family hydrolase [Anaerolineae bacterium]|nr:HAD family hydrolase [Anaerolineae bacterium]